MFEASFALSTFDSEIRVMGVLIALIHKVFWTQTSGAGGQGFHTGSLSVRHSHIDLGRSAFKTSISKGVKTQEIKGGGEVAWGYHEDDLLNVSKGLASIHFQ